MMINQFKWFCEVVAVRNNNFRIIVFKRDHHPLTLFYRVDLIAIYNNPDI